MQICEKCGEPLSALRQMSKFKVCEKCIEKMGIALCRDLQVESYKGVKNVKA